MLRSLFLYVLLLLSIPSFAGKITGTIKDSKDSTGLPGVIVGVKSLNKNVPTDIDGHFEINDLADGTYELSITYTSYKKQVQKVTVNGETPVVANFYLLSEHNQMTGVSVKATRNTQSEVAVLSEIRKSTSVVSGISAAQISKTMDRNAADVVKRIPGVTIQDDRFITVRGLADRYNTVWLNDAGAPSAEVDKKSFSFDLIPSGLIDRILVFKTPSPELPGDFAGGMVKIYTTSLPAKNTYTFGIQTSYRSGSTGTDFNYNKKSSTDWLGYDNGMRSLPQNVSDPINKNASGYESINGSFNNDWVVMTKKQPLDLRLNASVANIFNLGKVKIGNTLGLSYSNTSTNYNVQKYDWEDTTKQYHYNDQSSIFKVNVGLMDNLAFVIGNTKIEFKNLYNQASTSALIYRTNVVDEDLVGKQPNERSYSMGYDSRAIYTTQLSGSHKNNSESRKYNWTLGYTDLFKNQPSLRRIKYNEGSDGEYKTPVAGIVDPVNGGGRFYSELYEHVYSFSHQFTQKVKLNSHFDFDINAGNYIEYKSRFYNARQLGYTIRETAENSDLLNLPINEIFDQSNIGKGKFQIDESTNDFDHYNATNRLIASFVSLNIPITSRIKMVGGVRYENNYYTLDAIKNTRPVAPKITTDFLLPSVNLSYNFSTKSLLRLAYGKTVNRPEFRETAPIFFYDFELRAGTYGAQANGDTLQVSEIHNIDARYEWYPSSGEVIQIGGFYKSFKSPVQQVSDGDGDNRVFTYINSNKSYVYGIEVDVRKNLTFIDDKVGSNFFKNFTMVGNLTLSKSELTTDSSDKSQFLVNVVQKSPIAGQSNYVVNVGAYYQNDPMDLQASLLYNVYGPRMYSLGTHYNPSIGELAFHSLDFTLSKTLFKHYIVNFGVQNLLDQSIRFVTDMSRDNKFGNQGDKPFSSYSPGRYFSFGVKVKF